MTARFLVIARTPLAPAQALRAVLDLDRHGPLLPFTRVLSSPPLRVGSRILVRTQLGHLIVDDPMVVERIDATSARLVKVGDVIRGDTEIDVVPETGGSRVTWRQSLSVRGLPPELDPLVTALGRAFYGRLVRRLLRGVSAWGSS